MENNFNRRALLPEGSTTNSAYFANNMDVTRAVQQTMLNISLGFNQKDFRRLSVNNEAVSTDLSRHPGAMLVRVERFGFSCNTLASAVAPGVGSVWPQAFAAQDDNFLLPVWGIAQVVAANQAEFEVDQWVFGWFPMSRYCLLDPNVEPLERYIVGTQALLGVASEQLPATLSEPAAQLDKIDLQVALRPLLLAAFMVLEELKDSHFWYSRQIIITCASSKTALGLSYFLQQFAFEQTDMERPQIVGLTSPNKLDFVRRHGHYDRVESYDSFRALDEVDTVLVDFSGNYKIQQLLAYYLKQRLIHSYALGACHWSELDAREVGIDCEFFSALDVYYQRRDDSDLEQRFQRHWADACEAFSAWLKPLPVTGPEGVRWLHEQILAGIAKPEMAYLCKL